MSWRIEFRAGVKADIEGSFCWYEQHQPGVGRKFLRAVQTAIEKLARNPFAHGLKHKKLRIHWSMVKRFPYRIVYRVDGDVIVIFAVVHVARHDRTWKNRL